MKLIKTMMLLSVLFAYSITTSAQETGTVVRYLPPESADDERMQYFVDMLKLALDKTVDIYGPYTMVPASSSMTQVQAMKSLMKGEDIDILHSMTNKGRERVVRPVRIPVDKGLIGMRLLMINKNDLPKFQNIKTQEGLSSVKMGQGSDWPDTEILKFNKMSVTTSPDYPSLFPMLSNKEIDAFPRAVFEIYGEIDQHKDKNFVVAPNVVLYYPTATYFFVKQGNKPLADRIETGLRRAIKDGSFDQVFNKYMSAYINKADLANRVIIKMNNPLLPEATPLGEKELWYNIN